MKCQITSYPVLLPLSRPSQGLGHRPRQQILGSLAFKLVATLPASVFSIFSRPNFHGLMMSYNIAYIIATIAYATVGILFALRGQRYWRETGILLLLSASIAGCFLGPQGMMDFLIWGGWPSLAIAIIADGVSEICCDSHGFKHHHSWAPAESQFWNTTDTFESHQGDVRPDKPLDFEPRKSNNLVGALKASDLGLTDVHTRCSQYVDQNSTIPPGSPRSSFRAIADDWLDKLDGQCGTKMIHEASKKLEGPAEMVFTPGKEGYHAAWAEVA